METRIRTGENLKCDYTGKEYPALIKIYPEEGGEVKTETGWMGREVLANALGMINSLTTRQPTQAQAMTLVEQPQPQQVANSPRIIGQNVKDSAEVVNAFRTELVKLIADPPKSRDGETAGLGELHVRELVKQFKPTFRNTNAMFPVLQKELGMDRNRFETIIAMVK